MSWLGIIPGNGKKKLDELRHRRLEVNERLLGMTRHHAEMSEQFRKVSTHLGPQSPISDPSRPQKPEAKPKMPGAVPTNLHRPIPNDFEAVSWRFDHDPKFVQPRDSSAE